MDAPPVASPVESIPAAARAVPVIIEWRAGIVRCGAKTLEPERIEAPFSLPSVSFPGSLQIFKPIGVLFDVDARGRAINVAPELERSGDAWDSSDAEAAVAGSQFRAGPPVAGCRVAYTPQTIEVAEASVESLAGVVSGPYARGATLAYRKRMIALGATCMITPVIARTASFPNPDLLPGPPGSFVRYAYRYDIDANGRVVNMKAVFPTQLADKGDSEMRRALAASTFAPEARSGCYSGVGGAGSPSQAPTRPADSYFAVKRSTCPSGASRLLRLASVPFPESFRRRNILGWAVIRFDVAQWGEVGNARIADAQPAQAFGRQALDLVKRAKPEQSLSGKSGCLAFVRFETNADWSQVGITGGSGPIIRNNDEDLEPIDE